ncbi:MAG: hypothetical protein AB8C84_07510 [Oligoflexales bacterium]
MIRPLTLLLLSSSLYQTPSFSNPYKMLFLLSDHGTKTDSQLCEQKFGENPGVCAHERQNQNILCEGTVIWPHLIATSASCAAVIQHNLKTRNVLGFIPSHKEKNQHFAVFEATPLHQMGIGWVTLNHSYNLKSVKFDFPHFEDIKYAGSQPLLEIKDKNVKVQNFQTLVSLEHTSENSYLTSTHLPNGAGVFSLKTGRLIGVFSGFRDPAQNSIIRFLNGTPLLRKPLTIKLKHSASSIQLNSPKKTQIIKSPSNQSLKDHKKNSH